MELIYINMYIEIAVIIIEIINISIHIKYLIANRFN